jgi:hypothetical protein
MREVDTDALRAVAGSLGVQNPVTAVGQVVFDDENLQQVLVVNDLIRRGRTFAKSEGLWTGRIINSHTDAESIATTVDPYAVSSPLAGYPSPLPAGFDVWLLDVLAVANATGVLDNAPPAWAYIQYPATSMAFGGTAQLVTMALKVWDTDNTLSGGAVVLRTAGVNQYISSGNTQLPVRIPRGAVIGWNSTSLITGTLTLLLLLGVFPSGLGQDGR